MAAFGSFWGGSADNVEKPAVGAMAGGGDWFGQFGGKQGVDFNGATMNGPPGSQGGPLPPGYVVPAYDPTKAQTATGGGDPWQSFESILGVQQGGNLSPQMLLAKENELKAAGITLIKNAAGLPGKVQFSNGAAYDVIQGAGAGQNIYQRLPLNAAAGGSSGGGGAGGFGALNFNSPYQQFTAPSLEDARNSPGYQFAKQEGLGAIQKSAAAKGNLLTGGTEKALMGYGTGLADSTYGNVFNRAFQANQANFSNGLQTNQTNYGNLYGLAALGKPS